MKFYHLLCPLTGFFIKYDGKNNEPVACNRHFTY